MSYPILEIVDGLKDALKKHTIVILQAPPGAGKSTILPLELLNEPWLGDQKVIMLEPRRLAARSVAQRMASLKDEEPGETIGFRVRFEKAVSKRTRIEVVSEGILTRMIQSDNSLEGVGLIIFDEFHERSLQADLALTLALQVQGVLREDLRILIMSATLDGEKLSSLLGNAPIISSRGRQFPVSTLYINRESDVPLPTQVTRVIRKALQEQRGDLLVFLPGIGEIRRTQELLETENINALICPLYGDLPFKKQQEAIIPDRSGSRKVVLATAIAETSLTIEGITTVIDSGYSRTLRFDPRSGLSRLETVRVTNDAADQRAGRAGRLGPGVCYRLWSEGTHQHLISHRSPEILEADLAPLMLELAGWGIKNVNDLTWITPPPAGAVRQAKELLEQLNALHEGIITARGKEMVELPTHPRIAHMLIEAVHHDLLPLATDIAALLEERDPLDKVAGADITLRLEALHKWRKGERVNAAIGVLERIERLAASWRKWFNIHANNAMVVDDDAGFLIAAAYPERLAKQAEKNSERYKLVNGRVVKLDHYDPLTRETWIAVAHLDAGSGEGKIFLAAPVLEEDLYKLSEEREVVRWDDSRNMIVASRDRCIGNLVLESKPLQALSHEKRIDILCDTIRSKGLKMLNWGEEQEAWCARVMSLRTWRPNEAWPEVSDAALLDTLTVWLGPYLNEVNTLNHLQRLDLNIILASIIPWDLQSKLDVLAPVRLPVPSGSLIRLNYLDDGRAPVMEVRLQEVFGLLETPAVNEGRTRVLMHLLSPGYRPVQVTQDLKSFWQNTYAEVRKELRARYPKHSWPEDPWTAEAVRGVKKKK